MLVLYITSYISLPHPEAFEAEQRDILVGSSRHFRLRLQHAAEITVQNHNVPILTVLKW
jgi:hypothetical protein